jgi:hypothetical protein
MLWFKLMIEYEGVHPLEGGAFRLKFRRDRRYGMPLQSRAVFYPRYAAETAVKAWHYFQLYRATKRDLKRVLEASQRWTYIDMAIEPARAEELDTLELYQATSGGEAAVAKVRREAASRERIPG